MEKVLAALAFIVITLAISFGLCALGAWALTLVWNFLVPGLFHGPAITFWQGVAIMTLVQLCMPSTYSRFGGAK